MRCCAVIFVFGLINAVVYAAIAEECDSDRECAVQWPESTCRNGRCTCPPNFVRRASLSRGWVCLSLQDAVTGQLGPPLTCPLPSGAGYRLILKNENGTVAFCHSKHNPDVCGVDHECIRAIGTFSADWDGVCCPRKELSCNSSSINIEQVGIGWCWLLLTIPMMIISNMNTAWSLYYMFLSGRSLFTNTDLPWSFQENIRFHNREISASLIEFYKLARENSTESAPINIRRPPDFRPTTPDYYHHLYHTAAPEMVMSIDGDIVRVVDKKIILGPMNKSHGLSVGVVDRCVVYDPQFRSYDESNCLRHGYIAVVNFGDIIRAC
ncbi:BPTI/Kunitz inhibitor domain-containing protein [Aphelenchoides besseyi]|nr:BPTI/Kunitz inhibitor domain-containing protein [Aphelenchoides besseyi]